MSKGSKRRPQEITQEEFEKNWSNIFNNEKDNPDSSDGGFTLVYCTSERKQNQDNPE